MYYEYCAVSCGVAEITSVGESQVDKATQLKAFKEALVYYYRQEAHFPAHVFFSDYIDDRRTMKNMQRSNLRKTSGQTLANSLRHKGTLLETPPRKNHNSGNTIKAWLFTPSREFLAEIRELANEIEPSSEYHQW